MPNIIINNICNLNCPYCFAIEKRREHQYNMSVADIVKIFDFTRRSASPERIGIIGGEPTIHPEIDMILHEVGKLLDENKHHAILFTNGIELEPYLKTLHEHCSVLINYNKPGRVLTDKQHDKILDALDYGASHGMLHRNQLSIGINVFPGETDYDYAFEAASYYGSDHLRISIVAPCAEFVDYRKDKHAYFELMKGMYLDLCKKAVDRHIRLGTDCGYIPECVFSETEKELVRQAIQLPFITGSYCSSTPCIDVDNTFSAMACFGKSNIKISNIFDYENLEQIKFALNVRTQQSVLENLKDNKCSACKMGQLVSCQGGCLTFAQK